MNIHLAAKALTVVGLLAAGPTASCQVVDTSSTGGTTSLGSSNMGSMFSNRPAVGSTLSPGSRSLFGSKTGTMSNGQGGTGQDSGFVGGGNRSAADSYGAGAQDGRHFVGAAQAGAGASGANAGRGASEGIADAAIAGARRPANANAAAGMTMGQQGSQAATRVPATLRIAFEFTPRSATRVSTQLARLLAKTPSIHSLAPIQVEVQGRTAILRGQVASEHDRGLAEQMARLEAGIEQVCNEIVVAGPSPAKEPAAANPGPSSSPQ